MLRADLPYVLNELADDMRLLERYYEPVQVYLKQLEHDKALELNLGDESSSPVLILVCEGWTTCICFDKYHLRSTPQRK